MEMEIVHPVLVLRLLGGMGEPIIYGTMNFVFMIYPVHSSVYGS